MAQQMKYGLLGKALEALMARKKCDAGIKRFLRKPQAPRRGRQLTKQR